MKVAIISDSDYIDKKGSFNATHNRIKYLQKQNGVNVDVYLLLEYENWLIRKLRHTKKREKIQSIEYDGIKYNILWSNFSLLTYIIRVKFHKYPSFLFKYKKYSKIFKKYNHISAHSTIPGLLALEVKQKYFTPYSITWHGSDIHTESKQNKDIGKIVSTLIKNAKNNFFVSQRLLDVSPDVNKNSKQVLYNGVDTSAFYKMTEDEVYKLKKDYGLTNKKNVAYFGGLVGVKNSELLPLIFEKISSSISDIQFHVIGDGGLRSIIEQKCNDLNLNVVFYGNRPPQEIPDLINCMDLILLPSKNEGLPLIALEALACGVPMIGSDVGGISEAIGIENVVPLDANFIDNFTKLSLKQLSEPSEIQMDAKFNWTLTAEKEYNALI